MIEVKYRGLVVGHSPDEGKTIIFKKDNPVADRIQHDLFEGQPIYISSRNIGKILEDNTCKIIETTELCIIKTDD